MKINSIFLFLILTLFHHILNINAKRTFAIDYENNQFVKDGQPFRYVSGSLHYFRVPSVLWEDRMIKFRAAGLNAIQTYIEWSSHEPEEGVYDFNGDNNLFEFFRIANKQNLSVILRAGPFMDAERDMGGFPYWLLSIDPKMKLRSSDPKYMKQLDKWYSYLLPKLIPYLYENGGSVISVQIENEFGDSVCDFEYTTHLRDLFRKYLGENVVLFTTDNDRDDAFICGKIDNVFATVDFGTDSDVKTGFSIQRRHQEFGPNVNSEFYSGWLDYWERPHEIRDYKPFCNKLDEILAFNASLNVYVMLGGTSFGFTAGSNIDSGAFYACPTSYDYDAPLSEAGDPTPKYLEMRKIIAKYMPIPDIPVPTPSPKMETNPIEMKPVSDLFTFICNEEKIQSIYPLTFEQLRQRHGFVLYSTNITFNPSDPAVLTVNGLGDRAHVFVDLKFIGILSRTQKIYSLPLSVRKYSTLSLLVENQGRICSGPALNGDYKGITSNVTLGPIILQNWTQIRIFKNWTQTIETIDQKTIECKIASNETNIPTFFTADFKLPEKTQILDTFLRLDGWSKGIAFLNGFNLGRYWPIVGPQITLYSPKHLFRPYPQINKLVLLELEDNPCQDLTNCKVQFVKTHVINGTTPYTISKTKEMNDILQLNKLKGDMNFDKEIDIQLNDIEVV